MSGSLLPLSPTMSIGSTNNKWEEINLAGEIHTTKKSGTIIENLSNNADDSWKISFKNNQWLCYDGTLEHAYGEFKQDPGYLYSGYVANSTITKVNDSKWKYYVSDSSTNAMGIDENDYLYEFSSGSINPKKISDTKWKYVEDYNDQICAIDETGLLYLWGCNTNNQLGFSSTEYQFTPVQIGTSKWKYVSTFNATFMIDENNILYGVGKNAYLGMGDNNAQSTPIKITDMPIKQIHNRYSTLGFLNFDGELYTYLGGYHYAQTSTTTVFTPTLYKSNTKWVSFADIKSQPCYFLLGDDGYYYSFGGNWGGYIGNGTNINVFTPIKQSETKWKQIYGVDGASSVSLRIGITWDDQYYYWGNQNLSQFIFTQPILDSQYTPMLIENKTKWNNIVFYNSNFFYVLLEETL